MVLASVELLGGAHGGVRFGNVTWFQQLGRVQAAQFGDVRAGRLSGSVRERATNVAIAEAVVILEGSGLRASTVTDSNGDYDFADLKAGTYFLRANKLGFAEAAFGRVGAFGGGLPMVIEVGSVRRVDLILPRLNSINGRVLDAFNEPVYRARVAVLRRAMVAGVSDYRAVATAVTDDLGEFRMVGVGPGRYVIRVEPLRFKDTRTEVAQPLATFYGDSIYLDRARVLDVGFGETIDLQVQVVERRTAAIEGIVASELRLGPGASIRAESVSSPGGQAITVPVRNGAFSVDRVVPGTYRISLQQSPGLWATATVTVEEGERANIALAARSLKVVAGRVITDEPVEGSALQGAILRVSVATESRDHQSVPRSVDRNMSFAVEIPPAPARISIAGLPNGWSVKTIEVDGLDVANKYIDSSTASQILIVLTRRFNRVKGVVTDEKNVPSPGMPVLVFPSSSEHWTNPGYVRVVVTDRIGSFEVVSLPPGVYFATALIDVEPVAANDPYLFEVARARATTFYIDRSETQTMRLIPVKLTQ